MPTGPNDEATQFLLDTMHDPKVSLRHRIEAAKTLLEVHGPNAFSVRWVKDAQGFDVTLRVIIEGISDHAAVAVDPAPASIDQAHLPLIRFLH
jgi:hypothetical protein